MWNPLVNSKFYQHSKWNSTESHFETNGHTTPCSTAKSPLLLHRCICKSAFLISQHMHELAFSCHTENMNSPLNDKCACLLKQALYSGSDLTLHPKMEGFYSIIYSRSILGLPACEGCLMCWALLFWGVTQCMACWASRQAGHALYRPACHTVCTITCKKFRDLKRSGQCMTLPGRENDSLALPSRTIVWIGGIKMAFWSP